MPVSPLEKPRRLTPAGGKTRAAPRPFSPLTPLVHNHSRFTFLPEDVMYGFDLTATSKEEQDKVTIDLLTSGGAYKERLAMPVVAELVVREQPEHLREFFMERLRHTLKIVRFTARPMVALARNSGPMQP